MRLPADIRLGLQIGMDPMTRAAWRLVDVRTCREVDACVHRMAWTKVGPRGPVRLTGQTCDLAFAALAARRRGLRSLGCSRAVLTRLHALPAALTTLRVWEDGRNGSGRPRTALPVRLPSGLRSLALQGVPWSHISLADCTCLEQLELWDMGGTAWHALTGMADSLVHLRLVAATVLPLSVLRTLTGLRRLDLVHGCHDRRWEGWDSEALATALHAMPSLRVLDLGDTLWGADPSPLFRRPLAALRELRFHDCTDDCVGGYHDDEAQWRWVWSMRLESLEVRRWWGEIVPPGPEAECCCSALRTLKLSPGQDGPGHSYPVSGIATLAALLVQRLSRLERLHVPTYFLTPRGSGSGSGSGPTMLDALGALQGLTELRTCLPGCKYVTPEGLSELLDTLRGLPCLRDLDAVSTGYVPAVHAPLLAALTALTRLVLDRPDGPREGGGLAWLGGLPRLRFLGIRNAFECDEGAQALARARAVCPYLPEPANFAGHGPADMCGTDLDLRVLFAHGFLDTDHTPLHPDCVCRAVHDDDADDVM
jgi:hypothetical protein